MSAITKPTTSPQLFRLMLYKRMLHPELFDLQGRRTDTHGPYEVETWITPGGHLVRFAANGQILTETVIDSGDHLPETGLVHAMPAFGEKDYEMEPENGIGYVTTVQSETLTDNLYESTLHEMRDFCRETGSLCHEWTTDGGTNLSLLDAQKYRREYHLQSYHLFANSGIVLRTQSIFEIVK